MERAVEVFREAHKATKARPNMTDWDATEAGLRAALHHLQDCKVSPQTVQSPPATATHVAIDDAEVERVARAMAAEIPGFTWDGCSGTTQRAWLADARAAIRAMQGQRWGVWDIDANKFVPRWVNGPESSTDKELMEKACERQRRTFGLGKYEVRPYDAEGEDIGKRIASRVASAVSPQTVIEIAEEINAAIRAAKGGTDGK